MPIPFIFIGLGAAAAALGVGKTVKAGVDQKEADNTNSSARSIVKEATNRANLARKNSGDALARLGEVKLWVLDESVKPFIAAFEKLHSVVLTDGVGMDELQKFRIDKQSFKELKEMHAMASSLAKGVAGGATIGAMTAFGAYSGAMALGVASTGTAIASLGGIAASNATLAFLGGGSLAVGGLGMAGGTAVLGGLVAGPALAIMGFVVGAKASANKENAYANLAEAKKFREEMKTVMSVCKGIRMRANMYERLLLNLNAVFVTLVYSLEQIIATEGTDFSKFSPKQKETVAASMSMAGAIKAVLDTPILTEDGALTTDSEAVVASVQKMIAPANG